MSYESRKMEQSIMAGGNVTTLMTEKAESVVIGNVTNINANIYLSQAEHFDPRSGFPSQETENKKPRNDPNINKTELKKTIIQSNITVNDDIIDTIKMDLNLTSVKFLATALDIPSHQTDEIESINQLFDVWKEKVKEKATISTLAQALLDIEQEETILKLLPFVVSPPMNKLAIMPSTAGTIQSLMHTNESSLSKINYLS